jgi:hypothetical protein
MVRRDAAETVEIENCVPRPTRRSEGPANTAGSTVGVPGCRNAVGDEPVLRKTTATLLDEAGLSGRTVADQLGHAHPSMATDVYLGRKIASQEAADALGVIG